MAGPALLCDDYLALPRAPEAWIIEDILPTGGLCVLYGGPKVGKSYLGLQAAADVASFQPRWLHFPIKTPGSVFYLQLDTSRSLWAARIEALKGGPLPGVRQVYFADRDRAPDGFDILDPENRCLTWVRDQITTINPVMCVLDTIRELHRGNESDSEQMMKVLASIQSATNPAAVFFIAHDRKEFENAKRSLMQSIRGTNYVPGRMDTVMWLSKHTLTYQGRTCEETDLHLIRDPHTQLWTVEQPGAAALHEEIFEAVLGDAHFPTQVAKADELARRVPEMTAQAWRRKIQKALKRTVLQGTFPAS